MRRDEKFQVTTVSRPFLDGLSERPQQEQCFSTCSLQDEVKTKIENAVGSICSIAIDATRVNEGDL